MSNLGGYQVLTQFAKKVGGPVNLAVLIAGGGYIILRPLEAVSKKAIKTIKLKIVKSKKTCKSIGITFEVVSNGKDESGLEFMVGDKFRVLESDNEAVLIEKVGDINNPYFVSRDFLCTISAFNA